MEDYISFIEIVDRERGASRRIEYILNLDNSKNLLSKGRWAK